MTTNLQFPASICLRVTRRCNAACAFCQAPNNSQALLSVREINSIARGLVARHVHTMKLSGGEPTVRPEIVDIVLAVAETGMKPIIQTNGITLSDELLEAAGEVCAEFKISIHRNSEINDAVLRVKSFDQILANLARIRSAGILFGIATVVEPEIVTNIRDMTEFALEHGARKVSFIPVIPRGRATAKSQYGFDSKGLENLRANIIAIADEYRSQIDVRTVDFRRKDYWIVENNGSLVIERWLDKLDRHLLDKAEFMKILTSDELDADSR